MIRILLLSCGTNACYHFAKTIKSNFPEDFYLIGLDTNRKELVATTNYLDEFYTVSPSSESHYYDEILGILDRTAPNYLVPSFDMDQLYFYPENPDLKVRNIKSLAVPQSTSCFYKTKNAMNIALIEKGFTIPRLYKENESSSDCFFAKPENGCGSAGISRIYGNQIQDYVQKGYIVQEVCKDPEVTVECFSYKNVFSCICRERLQTKAGVCTKARLFKDAELEKIAKSFSASFDVPVFYNIQFMKNTEDAWVITDVNLRMAGGGHLSYAVGWDEISAFASAILNKSESEIRDYLKEPSEDLYVMATYTSEITGK